MDTGIKVGDCMKTALITIDEHATAFEAAKKMADHKLGGLLVAKKGKVFAIVTDSDLVKKVLATRKTNAEVGAIATKPLISVSPEDDLSEAARVMGVKKIRRLTVVKSGKVVGIISSSDIVRISPSLYDLMAQKQALEPRVRPA